MPDPALASRIQKTTLPKTSQDISNLGDGVIHNVMVHTTALPTYLKGTAGEEDSSIDLFYEIQALDPYGVGTDDPGILKLITREHDDLYKALPTGIRQSDCTKMAENLARQHHRKSRDDILPPLALLRAVYETTQQALVQQDSNIKFSISSAVQYAKNWRHSHGSTLREDRPRNELDWENIGDGLLINICPNTPDTFFSYDPSRAYRLTYHFQVLDPFGCGSSGLDDILKQIKELKTVAPSHITGAQLLEAAEKIRTDHRMSESATEVLPSVAALQAVSTALDEGLQKSFPNSNILFMMSTIARHEFHRRTILEDSDEAVKKSGEEQKEKKESPPFFVGSPRTASGEGWRFWREQDTEILNDYNSRLWDAEGGRGVLNPLSHDYNPDLGGFIEPEGVRMLQWPQQQADFGEPMED